MKLYAKSFTERKHLGFSFSFALHTTYHQSVACRFYWIWALCIEFVWIDYTNVYFFTFIWVVRLRYVRHLFCLLGSCWLWVGSTLVSILPFYQFSSAHFFFTSFSSRHSICISFAFLFSFLMHNAQYERYLH